MEQKTIRENLTNYKPIFCAQCKSKNIAIITEYHKEHLLRTINIIIKYILLLFVIVSIPDIISDIIAIRNSPADRTPDLQVPYRLFVAIAIIYVILKLAINARESKTHIQCICKDCGKTWLHE